MIDPTSAWWGLRSSADGQRPGLPIIIFGGDHADVPLTPDMGATAADIFVTYRISAVFDLGHFRKGEQLRFVEAFASTLYHKNRDPVHVLIDEADAFAPQRALPETARVLGAIEDLVRRGRIRGIGITLITQRSAVLNKNVLSQTDTLVVLRLTAPQDRAAIDEWVKENATQEEREQVVSSMASLATGEAWFWSPENGLLKKVQIRRRQTFDSSATPKAGGSQVARPKVAAEVDLEAIKQKLEASIQRAKDEDPKQLRARIDALMKQLWDRDRRIETLERELELAREPIFDVALDGLLDRYREQLRGYACQLHEIESELKEAQDARRRTDFHPTINRTKAPSDEGRGAPQTSEDVIARFKIASGARRILDALMDAHPRGLTRHEIADRANLTVSTGSFSNYVSALRTMGLIETDGPHLRASRNLMLPAG